MLFNCIKISGVSVEALHNLQQGDFSEGYYDPLDDNKTTNLITPVGGTYDLGSSLQHSVKLVVDSTSVNLWDNGKKIMITLSLTTPRDIHSDRW